MPVAMYYARGFVDTTVDSCMIYAANQAIGGDVTGGDIAITPA